MEIQNTLSSLFKEYERLENGLLTPRKETCIETPQDELFWCAEKLNFSIFFIKVESKIQRGRVIFFPQLFWEGVVGAWREYPDPVFHHLPCTSMIFVSVASRPQSKSTSVSSPWKARLVQALSQVMGTLGCNFYSWIGLLSQSHASTNTQLKGKTSWVMEGTPLLRSRGCLLKKATSP